MMSLLAGCGEKEGGNHAIVPVVEMDDCTADYLDTIKPLNRCLSGYLNRVDHQQDVLFCLKPENADSELCKGR